MSINVPGWVYKRYAYGDISETELHELEKMAESLSNVGIAGAKKVVADKSNNLQKVMKEVPAEDRDDVLRALRQMKKQAAGCASHSKPSSTKKRLKKSIKKQADFGTAAAIMGGAALAPIAGHLAMRGINAMSRKSPQQMQQDLRRILQIHPDIGRPTDRRVQMAYATLVRLNPEYAEDPLIAGPLLKQIVDSRMDPANPMSASYMDPGMAKQLSEARKSHVEGMSTHGRGTLAGDMRSSIMGGVQNASGALMKAASAEAGSALEESFTASVGAPNRKETVNVYSVHQQEMQGAFVNATAH